MLHDQALTPLFAYVAILNALVAYERQTGALTVAARGHVSFGADGQVEIDDVFTGDTTVALRGGRRDRAPSAPRATNEFRATLPERIDLTLRVGERQESTTIERVWLDTTQAEAWRDAHAAGAAAQLPRRHRDAVDAGRDAGAGERPADAARERCGHARPTLEQRDLKPGKPSTWPALLAQMNATRRNNRLYVRLISSSAGHGRRRRHAAGPARVGAIGPRRGQDRRHRAGRQDRRRRLGAPPRSRGARLPRAAPSR